MKRESVKTDPPLELLWLNGELRESLSLSLSGMPVLLNREPELFCYAWPQSNACSSPLFSAGQPLNA